MNGRRQAVAALALALLALCAAAAAMAPPPPRLDGFNIIAAADHPFGGAAAERSIAMTKRLGADALAIVPFLWQATPSSAGVERGRDMSDAQLRAAIRQVRGQGMLALVKPHVWVPGSWAGTIAPKDEQSWRSWFADYQRAIVHLARVAAEEKAYAFVIGTELRQTVQRPEWPALIGKVRAVFPGLVFYVAHDIDGAERVPFWPALDAIGVSLYPPLGQDGDRAGRQAVIAGVTQRIDALAKRYGKPVIVGEVGLRSAKGAAAEPWQSAEERAAKPDPLLQAAVIADWMRALDRPSVRGVLVWRWFSDPGAGGLNDTDFTVQGKPAEAVLQCAWSGACARAMALPR
jgi:Glycoside Hydrolase Family 113